MGARIWLRVWEWSYYIASLCHVAVMAKCGMVKQGILNAHKVGEMVEARMNFITSIIILGK